MPLYDFLAPAYDRAFEKIYQPFRGRALEKLSLAHGTGQNFPHLTRRIGKQGHIIGLDVSRDMLRRAQHRAKTCSDDIAITLIHAPVAALTFQKLEVEAQAGCVDAVLCSYGLTSMHDPESAFRISWNLLKPGGAYLILDVHAAPRAPGRGGHTQPVLRAGLAAARVGQP